MVAVVEWDPDDGYAETTTVNPDSSYKMITAQYWARSKGNFDIFIPNILRYLGDRVNESIFLRGLNEVWESWKS